MAQITYYAPAGVTSINLSDGSRAVVVNGQITVDSKFRNELEAAGCSANAETDNAVRFTKTVTGGIDKVVGGKWTYGLKGIVPVDTTYESVLSAIKAALFHSTTKAVQFQDALYDLGDNYLPIIGGVEYIGSPATFNYTNNDWVDRNRSFVGGTRFTTTHQYCFWDGAADQAAVTPIVAAQAATVTADSPNIAVPDSSLFPVGMRVYFASSANGFYAGITYTVLTSAANVISVGLPDMVAVTASGSGAVSVSAGHPNDGTTGAVLSNLAFIGVKSAIKCGAKNVFGFQSGSRLEHIYVTGTPAYRAIDCQNFIQASFADISTEKSNGQWYGSTYDGSVFMPGNSTFHHLFNSCNGVGDTNMVQRGIVFYSAAGSIMNDLMVNGVQNNHNYTALTTQTSGALTNGSANIPVTDSSKFPVDMPVFISTAGNPNGFTTNATYFVVSSAANVIQLSANLGGTAKTSTGTATMAVNTYGYPALEVWSINAPTSTTGLVNSIFTGIDVEGNTSAKIVAQNINSINFKINFCDFVSGAEFCARDVSGCGVEYYGSGVGLDISSSSQVTWTGRINSIIGTTSPVGTYRLGTVPLTSFGGDVRYPALTNMSSALGNWNKTYQPIGMAATDRTASKTFTGYDYGPSTYSGAGGHTFTLPTVTDVSATNTTIGLWYSFHNSSAASLTVGTNGTQTFGNQAGKTSFVLPAGASVKCTGAKTTGGTLYWIAEYTPALP